MKRKGIQSVSVICRRLKRASEDSEGKTLSTKKTYKGKRSFQWKSHHIRSRKNRHTCIFMQLDEDGVHVEKGKDAVCLHTIKGHFDPRQARCIPKMRHSNAEQCDLICRRISDASRAVNCCVLNEKDVCLSNE